ncbi:MAG: neutral/alkaline non-lysosomal ceramidase N-terminal domain-containing protein [Proteobacteria bacterium]|nr:neutral/alkaline non-lysosomal ceramidase N-terminal domain-containing protein [Pseudomonadota bacterium]MBI3496946.1 neutral/alkaline non-lysosomal ceramidase N-terminal domain-containing protein [Pseudomonadota bacterium]
MTGGLKAGVGRADITPPVGIAHVNWGARTHDRAEGIDLPLWLTVLLLAEGRERIAIVDVDLGVVPTEDCEEFRQIVAEEAKCAPADVRISYGHTHAGPSWEVGRFGAQEELPGMELVPAYRESVRAGLRAATQTAAAALRPARIAAGYGKSDVSVNRRLRTPEGRTVVGQNWDGYSDQTVTVVRIDDNEENPIASLVGFGTHPIILAHENRLISPDYPGVVKRTMEELVGGTCLFLQGCAGDQMPVEGLTADLGAPRRIGKRLGAEAARVCLGLRTRPTQRRFDRVVESGAPLGIWVNDPLPETEPVLRALSRKVALPVRNYGSSQALGAEAEKWAAASGSIDRSRATPQEIAEVNFRAKRAAMDAHWGELCSGRTQVEVELHGIRLGPVGLIGAPLEPFARLGAEVRQASPLPVTQLAGYTNGWEGYVATPEEFQSGGYEVEWATPYAPTAASTLVNAALAMLRDLAASG